mmetsp:Transcript_7640/g.24470  ORF Transcript_7640/g.24470 Transcript_7640/m.24470 type:complete len:187 (-) Transcript_7640:1095-1655(-)
MVHTQPPSYDSAIIRNQPANLAFRRNPTIFLQTAKPRWRARNARAAQRVSRCNVLGHPAGTELGRVIVSTGMSSVLSSFARNSAYQRLLLAQLLAHQQDISRLAAGPPLPPATGVQTLTTPRLPSDLATTSTPPVPAPSSSTAPLPPPPRSPPLVAQPARSPIDIDQSDEPPPPPPVAPVPAEVLH